ncbi:aminotransferase class IV, partial [Cereibacter changlensis]
MGGSAVEGTFRGAAGDDSLRLIETLGWDGAVFPREERHLARLARAAARFGWRCEGAA